MARAAAGPANPPPPTLEQRLAYDLAMTGGTMPIAVIVADEDERGRARRWLTGRRHGRLLTIVTAAESEARRQAHRRTGGDG